MSDDDVESYQLTSYQLDLPLALVQDSIAGFESVGLEPIPKVSFERPRPFFCSQSVLCRILPP